MQPRAKSLEPRASFAVPTYMAAEPSHAHVLASRPVLAKPGLAAVLEALKMARDARMGKMGCNPASVLQVDQDSAWLFE